MQFSRNSKKLQTKNRVAGTFYIGYKLVDGKLTKKCEICGRKIKPRCKHSEKVQKTLLCVDFFLKRIEIVYSNSFGNLRLGTKKRLCHRFSADKKYCKKKKIKKE